MYGNYVVYQQYTDSDLSTWSKLELVLETQLISYRTKIKSVFLQTHLNCIYYIELCVLKYFRSPSGAHLVFKTN